jgi:phytoene dehydrogenase-like protein
MWPRPTPGGAIPGIAEGAFEGFAITDKIFSTTVKRTLPGLDNFFMAGQWVVPGGGVIPDPGVGKACGHAHVSA